jgi:hypothetical protein
MRLIDAQKVITQMSEYARLASPFGHREDSNYKEKLAAYLAIVNCIAMVKDAETVRRDK